MSSEWPAKVLLTGGAPGGGVDSFARALECGFKSLGIAAEVIEPLRIYARPGELRDLRVLKILSTSAAFAVPYARRAIVMAHGFPCARNQGWARTLAVLASFKLANWTHRAQLIAVSSYSALHLETIFNIRIDGIIKNPLHPVFANRPPANSGRHAIAYVGRLHRSKNVLQAVSAMRGVIQRHDGLEAWVIGGGPEYDSLAKIHKEEKRIKFWGILPREEVRRKLAECKACISGNPAEPFGIVYLEALSQGCAVVMPASGGGLEIAPDEIGRSIHLFSPAMIPEEMEAAIERALRRKGNRMPARLSEYESVNVAKQYLQIDARLRRRGEAPVLGRVREMRP